MSTQAKTITEQVAPAARCKWCVKRIGRESYRLLGAWHKGLCVPITCIDFTDTICPECEAEFFPDVGIFW
ncbi:MAG TPA: hypothetical protein VG347_05070 [Verrucomicrobiae bacterium]|nr:hypothetical protein [Verrucomicrobiae bacterium]